MKHEDSEPTGFQEREDMDFAEGVHIRQEGKDGMFIYAVFDGEDQVCKETGALGENFIITFAQAYSKAKKRYTTEE